MKNFEREMIPSLKTVFWDFLEPQIWKIWLKTHFFKSLCKYPNTKIAIIYLIIFDLN